MGPQFNNSIVLSNTFSVKGKFAKQLSSLTYSQNDKGATLERVISKISRKLIKYEIQFEQSSLCSMRKLFYFIFVSLGF